MGLFIPGFTIPSAPSAPPLTYTYLGTGQNSADLDWYTWSLSNLGDTSHPDNYLLFLFACSRIESDPPLGWTAQVGSTMLTHLGGAHRGDPHNGHSVSLEVYGGYINTAGPQNLSIRWFGVAQRCIYAYCKIKGSTNIVNDLTRNHVQTRFDGDYSFPSTNLNAGELLFTVTAWRPAATLMTTNNAIELVETSSEVQMRATMSVRSTPGDNSSNGNSLGNIIAARQICLVG
jgi:hypothetical protein